MRELGGSRLFGKRSARSVPFRPVVPSLPRAERHPWKFGSFSSAVDLTSIEFCSPSMGT